MGVPGWLPLADAPMALKAGQRLIIDGQILPSEERFLWDKTKVRIVEDRVPLKAERVSDIAERARELHGRLLEIEGLLDRRQMEDATHMTFSFLSGGAVATAHILKSLDGTPPAFKEGDWVRIKCVNAPQFDRDGKLAILVLWVARPEDVQVIGSLRTDARFQIPLCQSEDILTDLKTNELLHVQGIVRRHEPGKWVVLWDTTGQILVQSSQTQPLRAGDQVEAIGYPLVLGVQQCLMQGLYRFSLSTNASPLKAGALPFPTPLRLADQVRALSPDEASRHLPVQLYAFVTWQNNQAPFAFVQDASSGIRLMNPQWETTEAAKPGAVVSIRGITDVGGFVPVITNAVVRKAGWWNLDAGKSVSLEEAMTGVEDGHWVQMRGFVREVTDINGLWRLDLSTPSGEFQAWVNSGNPLNSLRGSIVRVHGVCAAVSNSRHQLTGIQIWSPEARFVQVEEPAPDDLFAAPLRSAGSLRRFNLQNTLNQRVRTEGNVVLHVPGRYVYVQDGEDSVFALSQQKDALQPGDRVEVVGFPGNQSRRFLLREAVYRRVSPGKEPAPVQISGVESVNLEFEGRLATAHGILLSATVKNKETRLLIHSRGAAFENQTEGDNHEASRELTM